MPKRYSPRRFRNMFIEAMERRWLLNAAIHPQAVALQAQVASATVSTAVTVFSDGSGGWNVGMEGVTVYIDTNDNGKFDGAAEPSATTASSGTGFLSTDLAPGTYHIRQVVPAGFHQVSPKDFTAVVTEDGQVNLNEDGQALLPGYFGNWLSFVNTNFAIIDGTSGADQILVEPDPAGLRVMINGSAHVQKLKGVHGLWLRGKAGDDQITIAAGILLPTYIEGGNGVDIIIGGGGTNTVLGGRGNDSIYGGTANDSIDAGAGNDVIYGGAGNDSILGNIGNDVISGDVGDDFINGGAGSDSINGDAGNDSIQGDAGNDFVKGGAGNDVINGGVGSDSISGDADDDTIGGDEGSNLISGGTGNDHIDVLDFRTTVDGGLGYDELTFFGKQLPPNIIGVEKSRRYVAPKLPHYGCFLTTAVVAWQGKADNCLELTLLRKFRDTYMRGLPEGPDMIRDYYAHAQRVVRAIENNGLGGLEWPRVSAMIQTAIHHIQSGRNADALAVYAAEYLRLKSRYA